MKVFKLKSCFLVVLTVLIALFSACKSEDDETVAPTLNVTSLSLEVGEEYTLKSSVEEVVWASENATIAKVDARGRVVGLSAGTTKVTVSAGNKTAECSVEVHAAQVVTAYSVKLNHTEAVLKTSETLQLTAEVRNGSEAHEGKASFASRNESVATVTENGLVTAVALGEAEIVASYGNSSASCRINVTDGETQILLSAGQAQVQLGQELTLSATVWKDGQSVSAPVVWSADNDNVAVEQSGKLVGARLGDAVVTASYGGVKAVCRVRVYQTETIASVAEFLQMRGDSYTDYELVNDLDFSDYEWKTENLVLQLSSSLNGNGHKLFGLKRTQTGDFLGIFGKIDEGVTVENLAVYVDEFVYNSQSGAFAVENCGEITNCYFKLTTKSNAASGTLLSSGLVRINRGKMSGLLVDINAYAGTSKTVKFNALAAYNCGVVEKNVVISSATWTITKTVNEVETKYVTHQLLSGAAGGYKDTTYGYEIGNDEDVNRTDTLIFLSAEHLLGVGSDESCYAIRGETGRTATTDLDAIKATNTEFGAWFGSAWEFSESGVKFHGVDLYTA